jgi:acyl-CoA oxidase
MIEAARAHAELVQWEAFSEAVAGVADPATHRVLTWLRDLFGMSLIEKNLAWYLIHGRLSAARATAVTDYIDDRLLPRLRPHALDLVAAFGFAPEHVRAPIASGAERIRQDEAAAHRRA